MRNEIRVFSIVVIVLGLSLVVSILGGYPQLSRTEMTAEQEAHSKLYFRYSRKPKLEDNFPPGVPSIRLEEVKPLLAYPASGPRERSRPNLACQSDTVILGVVQELVTNPTAEHTFTFTDYTFRVVKVIRNKDRASIQRGDLIVVTRPGGTLTLPDGRTITAVDDSEPPLGSGGEYLFYLRLIPQTKAYRPVEEDASLEPDTYQIKNGKLPLLETFPNNESNGTRIERQAPSEDSLDTLVRKAASCK